MVMQRLILLLMPDGGLPKAETYIIGTNAKENTQPIYNDYTYHYSTVVVNTPQSSSCPL